MDQERALIFDFLAWIQNKGWVICDVDLESDGDREEYLSVYLPVYETDDQLAEEFITYRFGKKVDV